MAASTHFPSRSSPSLSAGGVLATHYDVFLSLRGPDVRDGFADHLYSELIHGATPHVFRDEEIRGGEEIESTKIEAIEMSSLSIPIISPRYAESKACLMELAHMSLCRKTKRHKVIPIFYLTEPDILEGFPQAFSDKIHPSRELDEIFGNSKTIIEAWKEALSDLADDPSNYHCLSKEHNRPWNKLFSEVVADVKAYLRMEELVVTEKLVGVDHHIEEMIRKLGVVYIDGRAVELLHGEEVRVVTITGIAGVGKTTLAKIMFNKIQHLFEACSFLENIQESLRPLHRLESLQKQLISHLSKQEFPQISYDIGINALKTMFKKTRVLIIFDDVCDIKDVEGLAADCNWFGPGSRIVLTSDRRLQKAGLTMEAQEHTIEAMSEDLAIQLFHKHAYGQNLPQPSDEFELLARKIVDVAAGIPSAIETVGSFLHGKDIVTWVELLDQLKHGPHNHFPSESSSLSARGSLAGHYNVFLSFWGPDARYHFADTLYRELKAAGISCVFRDEEEIYDGDIDATLIQMIEQSDISIPIISPHYTDSKACLMQLAHMSLCRKTRGHKVILMFYLVEPSIVESFPGAFTTKVGPSLKLAKIFGNREKTIQEWEAALSDLVKKPPKYFCLSKIATRSESTDRSSSTMQDSQPSWTEYWSEFFSAVVSDVRTHLKTGTIFAPVGIPGCSSSSTSYDVCLSFCGLDTRRGFADFLYHGLVDAGFRVFRDVEEIPSRVDVRTEIIEQSKIVIPIISRNYASNRFLMFELAKIHVLKKRTMNRSIIPVYYYVNPLHERNCEGYFGDQISKHEQSGVDPQAIDLWKQALREIANLKGFWISDNCDGEASIMKRIISTVIRQLHTVGEVVPTNLVGVEHHVQNILKKLEVVYDRETVGVRVVGICGKPGIGKTTLARVVYDELRPLYCFSAFLADIGERSLAYLQEQLIWDLQKPEYTSPVNYKEGREILKRKFRQKRVLIVLDDVGDFEQIKALAANPHWFGQGSRIIITSKTRDVLDYYIDYQHADAEIYDELGQLESDKALELFCKHAFGDGVLQVDYKDLSNSICFAVGGLPLAIVIVGSYLKGKEKEKWEEMKKCILEEKPNTEVAASTSRESSHVLREIVKEILRDLSATNEDLGKNMKEMFFDIACFLFAADVRFAQRMWSSCNRSTNEGMQELQRLYFVETAETNKLGMHEQLRGIGREMAEQEDLEEHGARRRLWNHHEALLTLQQEGKDTAKVEALCLTLDRNEDICFKSENFEGLSKLKYVRLNHAAITGDFENLLSELRWLEWRGCPGTFEARNLHLDKLVVLDLSWSNITEDWLGWRQIQMPQLKVLNLTGCIDLLVTPKFSAFPNLEMLILEHCHKLGELDSSIVSMGRLACLNLKFCRSLHELPEGLGSMDALEELLIDDTTLKEIPGFVGENELEALRASSIQHPAWICPPEANPAHASKQLKIFDRGNIYIERNSKGFYLELTGKLVGIDHHVQEIMRKLDILDQDGRFVKQFRHGVHVVQIYGEEGVGKTTIAKVVYDKVCHLFPCCAFLEDITENSERKRILPLQRQLISNLRRQECPELNSSDEAALIIKNTFRNQRVLIVFDNVNSRKQIHPFMQKLNWFGPGSKIIITTPRKSSIVTVDESRAIAKYEVKQMSYVEALQLFNKHAFRGSPPEEDYCSLSREIISAIGRLPLSIEVVASHLYSKRTKKDAWKKTKSTLKTMVPRSKFQKAFMVNFNSLSQETKKIFLDIACFLVGKDKRFTEYLFEGGPEQINILCDMSLVKIRENNKLDMHGELRKFGRKVAGENSKGCTRLWNPKDALSTLRKRKGGNEVVALALEADERSDGSRSSYSRWISRALELIKGMITDQPECSRLSWLFHALELIIKPIKPFASEDFRDLRNLRFLKLGGANIHGNFDSILLNLTWLDWQGCPETLEATNLHLQNLIILELSWSKVTQDWKGWSQLQMINLKVLNLMGCTNLLVTPDLSHCQCLEMLILEGCIQLVELHPSIGDLKSLVSLNLKSCSGLNTFPEKLDELRALEELLFDGTSIHEIPTSIGDMKQLKIFSASGCTRLSRLPYSIGKLIKLQKLSLSGCCRLLKIPDSVGELGASLKELDVSGTCISRLPHSITNLQSLKVLRMDSCFITEFPHDIGKLSRLEEIHASWCTSMEGPIPNDIGKVKGLKILRLQHSRISSLPVEIQQLSSLQTLDLVHCDMLQEFPRLPSSLTDLHVDPKWWKIIRYSETTKSIRSMVLLPHSPQHQRSDVEEIAKLMQVSKRLENTRWYAGKLYNSVLRQQPPGSVAATAFLAGAVLTARTGVTMLRLPSPIAFIMSNILIIVIAWISSRWGMVNAKVDNSEHQIVHSFPCQMADTIFGREFFDIHADACAEINKKCPIDVEYSTYQSIGRLLLSIRESFFWTFR